MFEHYAKLLDSENYVTRRQSLKLLGELLLDRANFSVMSKYISEPENLKVMMNMLRDKSKNIQFEAFHVFKVAYSYSPCLPIGRFSPLFVLQVFVTNPNKSRAILDILLKNREKVRCAACCVAMCCSLLLSRVQLVEFLKKFHENRAEDEQFADEKQYLIKQIQDLK